MSGKLIYYYGTVSSSKTMTLLAIAHNYDVCNWNVCVIKPALDTRSDLIVTRAGVQPRKPDIVVCEKESLYNYKELINKSDVILVDECQFLSEEQIDELRKISAEKQIDVLCFGLRTDFNTRLFPASKRLFELSDEIIEVKTICHICGKHASYNKLVEDKNENTENNIIPGFDNFQARCWKCYNKES